MSLVRAQFGEPKNSKSTDLEFFYPSRRLGISSDASRYIIKGGFPPLHLITHQRASSCGLMIYNTTCWWYAIPAELMICTPYGVILWWVAILSYEYIKQFWKGLLFSMLHEQRVGSNISGISLTAIVCCANWLWICRAGYVFDEVELSYKNKAKISALAIYRSAVCMMSYLRWQKRVQIPGSQTKSSFVRRRIFVCIIHYSLFIYLKRILNE